jgi:hypothetical protein
MTHELGVALGLGMQSDQADRLGSAVAELARGVDDPHRRLATTDDRQAAELLLEHLPAITSSYRHASPE